MQSVPGDSAARHYLLAVSHTYQCAKSDVSAVLRGIQMSYVPAPLHRIHVQSKLITGFYFVGVHDGFLVDGVDFIMGNLLLVVKCT